jgi:hypothetical protein
MVGVGMQGGGLPGEIEVAHQDLSELNRAGMIKSEGSGLRLFDQACLAAQQLLSLSRPGPPAQRSKPGPPSSRSRPACRAAGLCGRLSQGPG